MSEVQLPVLRDSAGAMVPVTAAVHPLRTQSPIREFEAGRTIQSIVQEVCPVEYRSTLLVTINGEDLHPDEWETRRVCFGDVVVFRAVPQGNAGKIFRSIIQLVVMAVAFIVLTPFIGPGAALMVGSILGHLLANALIPPAAIGNNAGGNASTQTFGIANIQNQELPYGVVPRILGRTLVTPPKGAHSYTVTQANDSYLYALFDLGPGPVAISNIKLGQTPIDSFVGVTYEIREGRASDAPITLYTNAVTQSPLSVALNDPGDSGTQRTPLNTSHVEIDIVNPGGLFSSDDKGNLISFSESFTATVTRVSDSAVMASVPITMSGKTSSAVSSSTVLFDGSADVYDVAVSRTTTQPDARKGSAKAFWSALRTWSPISGSLLPQNHAKIAVKIKATEQLNGDIANLNCIAQAYVQVWDGSTFTEHLNTHPAWAAYTVMTGSANARPLDSSRIDLAALLNWATVYPSAEFNYVFSQRATIWQALRTIGSAGRAQPVIRDGVYSFVFDRVQDTPVQLFTKRNVSGFKASKQYINEIQAMEVRYVSETMGWQQNSVYVYADGYNAQNIDSNKISPINLTGVTSDGWAYKLGSYFFAQGVLRPTTYSFSTDLDHLACNPGDRVWVEHDVITSGVASGRANNITRSSGKIVSIGLDETITGDGVSNYLFRHRTANGNIYTLPVSVPTVAGHTLTVITPFDDTADPFAVGDLAALSTASVSLLDAIVKTISPSSDYRAVVTLLDYAPSVHNGDAVTPPPVFNNRTNTFLFPKKTASVTIDSLTSSEADAIMSSGGYLSPRIHGHFTVNLDGYAPELFQVQWQKAGDFGYKSIPDLSPSAREFYIPISYSDLATAYNVRVRGNMVGGADPSSWTVATLQLTDFVVQPAAPTQIVVTAIIGGVAATITPGAGTAPARYNLYVGTTGLFADAQLVASGPTGTLVVSGLKVGQAYVAWGTTTNGAGVESQTVGPVGFVPLPVGYDSLAQDVTDFLTFQGNSMRDAQDAISALSQTVASLGLGGYTDVQQIRTELHSATASLTADYTSLITVATGPSSALATSVTALQVALTGYTGPSAVANAFTTTNANVTTLNGTVTSLSSSVTTLNSQVGNSYASGLFRVTTQSTPAGADARIALQVAASSGGSPYTASIFLDAMTGGGSRITMIADKIFMTDGSTNTAPFFFSGGTLNINNAVIQNLTAGSIQTGTLTTATLNTNAATDILLSAAGSTNVGTHNTWIDITWVTITQVVDKAPILVTFFGSGTQSGAIGSVVFSARILLDHATTAGSTVTLNGNNVSFSSGGIFLTDVAPGSHTIGLGIITSDFTVRGYPYYDTVQNSGGSWFASGTINVVCFKR